MSPKKGIRKWMIWAVVIAISFSLGFIIRQPAGASTTEPGTASDPLASQSYVDSLAKWQLINIPSGQKFLGWEGTEFIVRMGKVTCIQGPSGGLSNLTTGKNIAGGAIIPLDNHILIPRADNNQFTRGFRANEYTLVMVRGPYVIQK